MLGNGNAAGIFDVDVPAVDAVVGGQRRLFFLVVAAFFLRRKGHGNVRRVGNLVAAAGFRFGIDAVTAFFAGAGNDDAAAAVNAAVLVENAVSGAVDRDLSAVFDVTLNRGINAVGGVAGGYRNAAAVVDGTFDVGKVLASVAAAYGHHAVSRPFGGNGDVFAAAVDNAAAADRLHAGGKRFAGIAGNRNRDVSVIGGGGVGVGVHADDASVAGGKRQRGFRIDGAFFVARLQGKGERNVTFVGERGLVQFCGGLVAVDKGPVQPAAHPPQAHAAGVVGRTAQFYFAAVDGFVDKVGIIAGQPRLHAGNPAACGVCLAGDGTGVGQRRIGVGIHADQTVGGVFAGKFH